MTNQSKHLASPRVRLLCAAAAAIPVLGGCVATVGVEAPPPPRAAIVVEGPAVLTAEIPPPPLPVYEQPLLP